MLKKIFNLKLGHNKVITYKYAIKIIKNSLLMTSIAILSEIEFNLRNTG